MVFCLVGDARNNLTLYVEPSAAASVSFDFVGIELASAQDGCVSQSVESSLWVAVDDVEFHFVAETYDREGHAYDGEVYSAV